MFTAAEIKDQFGDLEMRWFNKFHLSGDGKMTHDSFWGYDPADEPQAYRDARWYGEEAAPLTGRISA